MTQPHRWIRFYRESIQPPGLVPLPPELEVDNNKLCDLIVLYARNNALINIYRQHKKNLSL